MLDLYREQLHVISRSCIHVQKPAKWIYYRTNIYYYRSPRIYIYITTNKILGNILMHYPTYIDIYAYIESLDNIPSEVQILKIEL